MTRLSQVVCPGGEDRTPGHTTPLLGESGVLHLVLTVNLFREARRWHSAAGVEGGRVMLLGGWDSRLTGEIVGECPCGL